MAPSNNLQEKVVLITGATSGIGRGCALVLAEEGCFLALNGRNKEGLEETKKLCLEKGAPADKVLIVQGDITKEEDCKRLVSETMDHFKQLDVLINNAGICWFVMVEEMKMEDYDSIMTTNLRGVIFLTKLCLPHLVKTKGNIINISSILSATKVAGVAAYSCSKAALDQFTRSLAIEVGCKGVRVNSINPGVIVTKIAEKAGLKDVEAVFKSESSLNPVRRVGQPKDIGYIAAFLASEKASYITGITLIADGGRSLLSPTGGLLN